MQAKNNSSLTPLAMKSKTVNGVKFFLYLFGLLGVALNAQGASFDCGKAATKVEKLICGDVELSKLDEEMNVVYKTAPRDGEQVASIISAQKKWLKVRNKCSDVSCLNSSYAQRIAQLKTDGNAHAESAPVAKTEGMNAGLSPLTAGWDYKQEGGGMGTEPYTIGGDDVMCQQVKDYMNRVAPNWKPYKEGAAYMENDCTSAVRLFPAFTEPPWTELDPRQYEELIVRLLRYREEGARTYFGFTKPPLQRRDGFFQEEARHFIEAGGRLQYWKTRLFDFATDPKDLIGKRLPSGDQHVIQLRFALGTYPEDLEATRTKQKRCNAPMPDWHGHVFIVDKDLNGPDPHILDGGIGTLSSSSLFIYKGRRVLLDDSGFEIHIHRERETGNDFIGICTLIYPYYKFEQRSQRGRHRN